MTAAVAASALPRLCVIADLDFVGDEDRWLDVLAALDAAGEARQLAIQVRAKHLDHEGLAGAARRARQAAAHTPLVLNGPPDLAAALGYEGVHWPAERIPDSGDAATRVGTSLPIRTAAIHDAKEVPAAEFGGATALVFAPVYEPGWKPARAAGLAALRQAAAAASVPVYALGGIAPDRVAACLAAGARGVAVLAGVMGAPDPPAAVAKYLAALALAEEARSADCVRPATPGLDRTAAGLPHPG